MRSTILLFLVLTLAPAGSKVKERHAVYPQRSEIMTNDVSIPSIEFAKRTTKISGIPYDGYVVGKSDYDYAINSGYARRVVSSNNPNKIHMMFLSRDVTQPFPLDRLMNKYVTFDRQSDNASLANSIHGNAVVSEGFGSIDVFTSGPAEGIAIAAYTVGNKAYFAIDGGPASGNFTKEVFPDTLTSFNLTEPQLTISPDQKTIWATSATSTGNCFVTRSTDYGTTWIGRDSLIKYLPSSGFVLSDKSSPMLIDKQGTLYRISTLKGSGAIPPIGNAHPDYADRIGYFKSTNNGTSWTWTTISRDGDPLIVEPGDTVYTLIENFSQFSGVINDSSEINIVANGYSLKQINDSTKSNRFYTLYWNSISSKWRIISNPQEGKNSDYDSPKYRYSENAFGFPYPSITTYKNELYVMWSQPITIMGKMDTTGGAIQYQLWATQFRPSHTQLYCYKISNTVGGLFPIAFDFSNNGQSSYVNEFYLIDSVRGSNVELKKPGLMPWIVRKRGLWTVGVNTSLGKNIYYSLSQNYPNPFNPSTTLRFELSHNSHVKLEVFDVLGKTVSTLLDEQQSAGEHTVRFSGSHLASGIYYYRMTAGSFSEVKKMILLR